MLVSEGGTTKQNVISNSMCKTPFVILLSTYISLTGIIISRAICLYVAEELPHLPPSIRRTKTTEKDMQKGKSSYQYTYKCMYVMYDVNIASGDKLPLYLFFQGHIVVVISFALGLTGVHPAQLAMTSMLKFIDLCKWFKIIIERHMEDCKHSNSIAVAFVNVTSRNSQPSQIQVNLHLTRLSRGSRIILPIKRILVQYVLTENKEICFISHQQHSLCTAVRQGASENTFGLVASNIEYL